MRHAVPRNDLRRIVEKYRVAQRAGRVRALASAGHTLGVMGGGRGSAGG